MRVARVYTNETCNHNCRHCGTRRPEEDRSLVAAARGRIEALPVGLRELVLAGGEPTRRRDLEALLRTAKSRAPERIVLRTNAATLDETRARSLADAGLDVARIHLPAWGERLGAIARDPEAGEAVERGARALARAGVALEALVPITRENLETVAELPAALASSGLPFSALVLSLPRTGQEPEAIAPLEQGVAAFEQVDAAARREGLAARLDPDTFVPPCLFEYPARVAHLFALGRGGARRQGWSQLPACAECTVSDRCPGLPLADLGGEGAPRPRPIREDRVRRRLSTISSTAEQIRRELQQEDVARQPGGRLVRQRIVRVNFRCNQACHFCFVSTHLPTAADGAVQEAIVGIARAGGIAVLSGGEPTLNPRLLEYVRLAKAEGASGVDLQTNAIRCTDPAYVAQLEEAGVDFAFVSLHASKAEISDAITNAPGTFEKTVRGIDELERSGIDVRLNFVFCEKNREDFPQVVDMVASRWPTASLTVSFIAPSTDMVPRDRRLIPRYTDILPSLSDGLRRAREHELLVTGFDSMCGIPLCLVPADLSRFFELPAVPEGLDAGELVKPEPCGRCALSDRCFGLRSGYAELHGTDELRPVHETSARAAPR